LQEDLNLKHMRRFIKKVVVKELVMEVKELVV
jgi:hypothetical protein